MAPIIKADDYYAMSPEGDTLKLSKALFDALRDFQERKRTGKITAVDERGEGVEVDMRNGGIAGVRGLISYS